MAFHFALASVLRLRQSVERQRSLDLQDAALQVARARDAVARLNAHLTQSATADASSLAAGRTGAELHFCLLIRKQLHELRVRLDEDIVRLESVRQQAAAAYQQAFREREVLENLRARQQRAYQVEQARREQRRLDAAHLLQRWHRREG
ncbi:MAG: flagellar export protein FliJ [Terriglobales bacterium]